MTTLADIGLDVPFFRADVKEADGYAGIGHCHFCGEQNHIFDVSFPAEFAADCRDCGRRSIQSGDKEQWVCPACNSSVVPEYFTDNPENIGPTKLWACTACLSSGRAAFYKTTACGYLALSSIERGGLYKTTAANSPIAPVAESWLRLLARTPDYKSIQGSLWLFCCDRPMVYEGPWTHEDFDRHSHGKGRQFFLSTIKNTVVKSMLYGTQRDIAADLWKGSYGSVRKFYVFKCDNCQQYDTRWDHD